MVKTVPSLFMSYRILISVKLLTFIIIHIFSHVTCRAALIQSIQCGHFQSYRLRTRSQRSSLISNINFCYLYIEAIDYSIKLKSKSQIGYSIKVTFVSLSIRSKSLLYHSVDSWFPIACPTAESDTVCNHWSADLNKTKTLIWAFRDIEFLSQYHHKGCKVYAFLSNVSVCRSELLSTTKIPL